ncbi:hypothetical protein BLSTO_02995, partial [Blastocystis sp. subtype 1]
MWSSPRVSVYERFRPQRMGYQSLSTYVQKRDDHSLVVSFPSSSRYYKEGARNITYTSSGVFDGLTTQETVFNASCKSAVERLFLQEDCLLVLYGVTGSGKTYTAVGSERDPGVLTRAVRLLLDQCKMKSASGSTVVCLKCSMACLHNDLIVDLLSSTTEGRRADFSTQSPMCIVTFPVLSHIQEVEFSTESQFRIALLKALRNRHSYEIANYVTSGYYHSVFTIQLYQSKCSCNRSQPETVTRLVPISILRVLDLAGCESRIAQSNVSPTVAACSSSLQALLSCIANASSQSSVMRLQQLFVPCPLTLLLRDQLIPARKGSIIVIHAISSLLQDFDAVACALNDLKRVCVIRSEGAKTESNDDYWSGVELCEKCAGKKDVIEERIRNTVVKEVFSRSQNASISSEDKSLSGSIRQLLERIDMSGDAKMASVTTLLREYDEETKRLEKENARLREENRRLQEKRSAERKASSRVEELEGIIEEKDAEILQLNHLIGLLKKSPKKWVITTQSISPPPPSPSPSPPPPPPPSRLPSPSSRIAIPRSSPLPSPRFATPQPPLRKPSPPPSPAIRLTSPAIRPTLTNQQSPAIRPIPANQQSPAIRPIPANQQSPATKPPPPKTPPKTPPQQRPPPPPQKAPPPRLRTVRSASPPRSYAIDPVVIPDEEELTPWGPVKRPTPKPQPKPRPAPQPTPRPPVQPTPQAREVRISDGFDSLASEIRPSDIEATISETLHLPAKPRESDDFSRPSYLEALYSEVMKTLDDM